MGKKMNLHCQQFNKHAVQKRPNHSDDIAFRNASFKKAFEREIGENPAYNSPSNNLCLCALLFHLARDKKRNLMMKALSLVVQNSKSKSFLPAFRGFIMLVFIITFSNI